MENKQKDTSREVLKASYEVRSGAAGYKKRLRGITAEVEVELELELELGAHILILSSHTCQLPTPKEENMYMQFSIIIHTSSIISHVDCCAQSLLHAALLFLSFSHHTRHCKPMAEGHMSKPPYNAWLLYSYGVLKHMIPPAAKLSRWLLLEIASLLYTTKIRLLIH